MSTCRGGTAQGGLQGFLITLTLGGDQNDGRVGRAFGEPDPQALREEPRLVRRGRAPEHAQRAAKTVGLDEEFDTAVAGARHRVVLDVFLCVDVSLLMRTSFGSPFSMAHFAASMMTSFAHPPPIQP